MFKNLQIKSLLLLLVGLSGSVSVSAADKWVKTAPADLTTGDVVVIVDQTSGTAMSNDKGTSSAPSATNVTLNDSKSEITSEVASTLQWEVKISTSNNTRSYQFGVAGTSNYVYCTATNNGVRVGTNSNNAFTVYDNEGVDFLVNTATSRYIGVYNSQDWRCYTSINANIKNCVTAFYKKVADNAPSITASDINIEYDATSGAVEYTINNEVDGGQLTAATTEDSWLTVGQVGETVPFTCEANTTAVNRTAAITLTYTYANEAVTKTVTVTQAGDPNATMTIAEVREQGSGSVTTKGIVTSCVGTTAYIQDATAAICVYGESLTVGDEIKVGGTLTTYNGLLEIKDPEVTVLSSGNTVTPQVMTIEEILADDKQGWLVKIEDAIVTNIDGKNTTIAQDDQTIIVYNITGVEYAVNDVLTLVGNIGCYNSVQIANPTDVEVTVNVVPSISVEDDEISVPAEGGDGNIAVTYVNVDMDDIELLFVDEDGEPAEYDWVEAEFDANNGIYYVVDANEGEARTAYIQVYGLDANAEDVYSDIITITQAAYVAPAEEIGNFVKVTSTADITDGQYLIVYENDHVAFDGSLKTLDAVSNTINVEILNDTIVATTENIGSAFTIDVTNGTLQSASGLYIGVSSNSNGLKQTDNAEDYSNSFAIDEDGNAVISAVFNESTMTLRFNSASNQARFRYYKSGQQAIQLYKFIPNTISATVTSAGWATWVPEFNVEVPEGVSAYYVTGTTDTNVILEELLTIPAGEPVVLQGEGTHQFSVINDTELISAEEENKLMVSDGSITADDGVYVLANHNNEVGFYKWGGSSNLGAGRVYLPAEAAPGNARSFLGFGDGTSTGIEAVESVETSGSMFDLQGRRVMQPTKGLYIVGGKKVVLK